MKQYVPDSCRQCEYYQPRWKYRTCRFTRCVYQQRDRAIFRRKPLKHDKLYYQGRRKRRNDP